ncbi:MAG: hypothetical protein J7L14_00200 [Candidatus Diapherotrites archaeon]|nr:hypothetical protein [Candidatus Diapherotrites archaeon]
MTKPHVQEVKIVGQEGAIDVDTLATEISVAGEIDTSSQSSPVTVLTPTQGKKISTRSIYITTNSTSGEIWVKFKNSGQLLAKLYCTRHARVQLNDMHFIGEQDEPIVIEWNGLNTGAKIFYAIRYKEV